MYREGYSSSVEALRRELGRDEESAGYCCKTAFTVSSDELPSEQAF